MPKNQKKIKDRTARLKSNLKSVLLQHIEGRNYRPSKLKEITQRLAILPEQVKLFMEVLEEVIQEGILKKDSQDFYQLVYRPDQHFCYGEFFLHPKGFGFVRPEKHEGPLEQKLKGKGDIFVPKGSTLTALPGDVVCVEVAMQITHKGPEGRVVNIVERGEKGLVGTLVEVSKKGIYAHIPSMPNQRVRIKASGEYELEVGDRLLLKVIEWEHKSDRMICEVVDWLGHITDPSIDTQVAMVEHGLRSEFPAGVLDEALAYGDKIPHEEVKYRTDFRHLTTLTIDPDTAKDFDDAISIERTDKGYKLWVHIADVAFYVKEGSELDKEAHLRGNSTYFPSYCLPMIPAELSNNLCSLRPGVERLTASVLMEFDDQGNQVHYEVYRSVIKSDHRFTYREAKELLDRKRTHPLQDAVFLMEELCLKLKQKRKERGSIEFALPEAVMLINEEGHPTGIDWVEYDITHQMIEEFMIHCNQTVATHLRERGKPVIYRVHSPPDLRDFKEFIELAQVYGYPIKTMPEPAELQKIFNESKDEPYFHNLCISYIKSMKLATYSEEHEGHYGLSLDNYCHFTSPIRRYSDLVVMRSLFDELSGSSDYEEISQHCSDRERISARAEISVSSLKKLRFLLKKHESEDDLVLHASIGRVQAFGFSFDVREVLMDGFIHVSQLSDDFYQYEERSACLVGKDSGTKIQSGSVIEVYPGSIELIYQEVKWEMVQDEALEKPKRKKGFYKKSSKRSFSKDKTRKNTSPKKRKKKR